MGETKTVVVAARSTRESACEYNERRVDIKLATGHDINVFKKRTCCTYN